MGLEGQVKLLYIVHLELSLSSNGKGSNVNLYEGSYSSLTGKVNWRNHQEPIKLLKIQTLVQGWSQYMTRCISYADIEKETTLPRTMLGHRDLWL